MPSSMILHAESAAALDDLLQRRDQQFSAIQTEPLGAGEFDIAELLEAFRTPPASSGSRADPRA